MRRSEDLAADLDAYAAVATALAEPEANRVALLGAAGLEEDQWEAVEAAWQARLSEAMADDTEGVPPLVAAYAEAFVRAQGLQGGPLLPFERFVEATRVLRSATDAPQALRQLGLTLPQFLAAQRHWAKVLATDTGLASRFVEALALRPGRIARWPESRPMSRFVPLATFAAVNAALQRGTPRDIALQEAGIVPATWDASLAFWLGRMADEASQQRLGLSQRYGHLYAEAQRAPQGPLGLRATPAFPADGHTAAPAPPGPASIPSSMVPSRAPATRSVPPLPVPAPPRAALGSAVAPLAPPRVAPPSAWSAPPTRGTAALPQGSAPLHSSAPPAPPYRRLK